MSETPDGADGSVDAENDSVDTDTDSVGAENDSVDTDTGSVGAENDSVDTDTDSVGADDVRHVAELARVDLADEEVTEFAGQFEEILDYFAALDEVPETDSDAGLVNVMRADEVREGLSQAAALSNAPDSEGGYFRGPRVS